MMVTAQGADHTAGNIPAFECDGKTTEELTEASLEIQTICAAAALSDFAFWTVRNEREH